MWKISHKNQFPENCWPSCLVQKMKFSVNVIFLRCGKIRIFTKEFVNRKLYLCGAVFVIFSDFPSNIFAKSSAGNVWYTCHNPKDEHEHSRYYFKCSSWPILLLPSGQDFGLFNQGVFNSNPLLLLETNEPSSFHSSLSTHFSPLGSFYTPWKHQKTRGFLMFSGGVEREQWHEMA